MQVIIDKWINNTVLLYSTGNWIQSPVINHNGKEYEKECTYVSLNYFAIQQKLTQHCKPTMPQLKKESNWDETQEDRAMMKSVQLLHHSTTTPSSSPKEQGRFPVAHQEEVYREARILLEMFP